MTGPDALKLAVWMWHPEFYRCTSHSRWQWTRRKCRVQGFAA